MGDIKNAVRQQIWSTLSLASGDDSSSPSIMTMAGKVIPDKPKVIEAQALRLKTFKDRYFPRIVTTPSQYLEGLQEDLGAGIGLSSLIKGAELRSRNSPSSQKYIRGTRLKKRGLEILMSPDEQKRVANRAIISGAGALTGAGLVGGGLTALALNRVRSPLRKNNQNELEI